MDNKKKVLFVATVVKGHINAFHIPFLKMLKENGYVTYVAAKNDFENKDDCFIPYCDKYFDISFERNPIKINNIRAYKQLKEIMLRENFDIVHCHTPVGGLITRLVYKNIKNKVNTKCIYTAHGFHFFKGASPINWLLYYPVEKYFSKYTDVLITINQEDYNLAKNKFMMKEIEYVPGVGVDVRKISTISSGRDNLLKELNLSDNVKIMLSVGELINRKNHCEIIKCLTSLPENIHYVICGRGKLYDQLTSLIDSLGLHNRVHLLGFRNDVISIIKSCDIFIFPSKQEGLPVAIMEAMACGVPVICSDIRGNSDLIKSGINGYICKTNISQEYIELIYKLLNNKKLMSDCVSVNHNIMKQYDINNIKKILMQIYKSN